jgi:hypothetical protein
MRRRRARSWAALAARTLVESKWTLPEVGSIRRRSMRATVDLPEPDSPTRPRVSPRWMVREMSSTTVVGP